MFWDRSDKKSSAVPPGLAYKTPTLTAYKRYTRPSGNGWGTRLGYLGEPFRLALGSPFTPVCARRNPTICGSLCGQFPSYSSSSTVCLWCHYMRPAALCQAKVRNYFSLSRSAMNRPKPANRRATTTMAPSTVCLWCHYMRPAALCQAKVRNYFSLSRSAMNRPKPANRRATTTMARSRYGFTLPMSIAPSMVMDKKNIMPRNRAIPAICDLTFHKITSSIRSTK